MCGICGIVNAPAGDRPPRHWVRRMLWTMRHRGPDDAGIARGGDICLGQVRLSILDLSAAGHQPMRDESGRYTLVYNGEIYNYRDIRAELAALGIVFRGHSDTEVLLYAYRRWGPACLERLSGMYAFAVWDGAERELFIARDRIGIKPLYYWWDGRSLAFASEIKGLLQLPWIEPGLDRGALAAYLMMRYNAGGHSVFENVRALPPAHTMRWRDGQLETRRYWRLEIPDRPPRRSEADCIEELRALLERSVREHLVSDVPLGVFLSGGVDSNTITSVASAGGRRTMETFSVGFSTEKGRDEIDNIRASSRHFGSNHHELILDPAIEDVLPRVVYYGDEPNADPACVPTYLLSKMAAEHVTVVLSGEGGDELFGGYERSLLMLYGRKYLRAIPPVLRSLGVAALRAVPARLLDRLFKYTSKLGERGFDRLADFARNIDNPVAAFVASNAVSDVAELRGMLRPEVFAAIDWTARLRDDNDRFFSGFDEDTFLNYELRYEIETRLWADLLMKLDNSSMPFSLEGRVPFLDHRLVEFSARIPPRFKIRGLRDKAIFRAAAARYLPDTIRTRKKDHFFVPIHAWLANELRPFVESYIADDFIKRQGIFNLEYTRRVYDRYRSGSLVYARQLWTILVFQIWSEIYLHNAFGFLDGDVAPSFDPAVETL